MTPEHLTSEHSPPEYSPPEHLTPDQIERFALPQASPDAERTWANAHLQTCAQCRAAYEQASRADAPALLTRLKDGQEVPGWDQDAKRGWECPDDDLLLRFVAGEAKGVEADLVEMHTEICALCRSEIAALSAHLAAMQATTGTTSEQTKVILPTGKEAAAILPPMPESKAPESKAPESEKAKGEKAKGETSKSEVSAGTPLLPHTRLRERMASPRFTRFTWRLALGGGALAACAALLLHSGIGRQTPAPSTPGRFISRSAQPALSQRAGALPADTAERGEQPIASLARKGGRIMGDPAARFIALLRPDGVRVNSLRPAFRWEAVPHAATYELTCIPQKEKTEGRKTQGKNTDGKKTEEEKSADVTVYTLAADTQTPQAEVAWTIPATQSALRPATTYTWIVRALNADKGLLLRSSTREELFFRTPDADSGQVK